MLSRLKALKAIDCTGTSINHSEHRIPSGDVVQLAERCISLGLITIVCTKNVE